MLADRELALARQSVGGASLGLIGIMQFGLAFHAAKELLVGFRSRHEFVLSSACANGLPASQFQSKTASRLRNAAAQASMKGPEAEAFAQHAQPSNQSSQYGSHPNITQRRRRKSFNAAHS